MRRFFIVLLVARAAGGPLGCTRASEAPPSAVDALMTLAGPEQAPALFTQDLAALLQTKSAGTLAERMDAAHREAGDLPPVAKALLQNDVWGFRQRLDRLGFDSPAVRALRRAATRLIKAAAPAGQDLARLTSARAVPDFLDGFAELDTEHVSLMHERLYGYRRLFRIYLKERGERALVSHLVVRDRAGQPHFTSVIGEVEMLRFAPFAPADGKAAGGVLVAARVFERTWTMRDGRPIDPPLREHRSIAHVPGRGANGFLARFEGADRNLDRLACTGCHEDATMMSLPTAKTVIRNRHARLLTELTEQLAPYACAAPGGFSAAGGGRSR